jgi:ABC-type ATPase involved in cell division
MESTSTPIIELENLLLASTGGAQTYGPRRIAIFRGDVVAIAAVNPADARRLLRLLATLEPPDGGNYRFNGVPVIQKNYRRCLAVKRQIGYVAADSAMISNRTLRENLLLTRFYYEDDLSIDIEEGVAALLNEAGLSDRLERRPSFLSAGELLKAIAIREMAKTPAVMLIEHPERFMTFLPEDGLFRQLMKLNQSGTALVVFSNHRKMLEMANRRLSMDGGAMQVSAV